MPARYVLWIKHCKECSNIEFKGKSRHTLCNKKGINQAYEFGEILKKYNSKIVIKYGLNGINFYSSYLPHAIQTSKLISMGYYQNVKSKKKINRLPFITDLYKWYNLNKHIKSIIPIYKSDCHVNALNDILSTGLKINIDHQFKDIIYNYVCLENEKFRTSISNCIIEAVDDDKESFYKYILPKLPINKLNIIVSHTNFIKKNILGEIIKIKDLHNLEAYLIKYEYKNKKYIPKYQQNKYIDKCNSIVKNIKSSDINHIKLKSDYINYFNCKYKYHTYNKIGFHQKNSIEKYCN